MTTTPANNAPLWLTTAQTAKLLNVSERCLYEIARKGDLPRVSLGARGVRYRRSDVERFAESFGTAA